MRQPEECQTKQEIRTEIDRLDKQLIKLFGERFAYVRRMAELKKGPDEAFVPERVDEVLKQIETEAEAAGFDSGLARDLWRTLIDWNIAYEREKIAARHLKG